MPNRFLATANNFTSPLIIIAFALITNGLLIANPGYYSHDELQKLDHVIRYGLGDYLATYVTIVQGDAFGTPVRPFAFLIQGGVALAMASYPVLVHLLDVLTHATVACLLYFLALQFGTERALSVKSALVFAISPLATIATGWPAALMDRWYVLFGLLALMCADRYVRKEQSSRLLIWIFVWSSLAIFSKETAIILPCLMILIWWRQADCIRSKRFLLAAAIWMVPIMALLLYRLPALISSFGDPQVSAYKASLANVPTGALVYLAYPFLVELTEAGNWIFVETAWIFCAIALHCLLLACVARLHGYRAALIYTFFYFLFLLPVLLIPIKAAHYLYGSSLALSVALAVLVHQKWASRPWYKSIGAVLVFIIAMHTIVVQVFVYSLGACMNRAMTSAEALYLSHDHPECVDFQAEPDAAEHVLRRITTGRQQIGTWFPVRLTVSKWGQETDGNCLSLKMNSQCIVHTNPMAD